MTEGTAEYAITAAIFGIGVFVLVGVLAGLLVGATILQSASITIAILVFGALVGAKGRSST